MAGPLPNASAVADGEPLDRGPFRWSGVRGALALGVAVALGTAWSLLPVLTTAIPAPADCEAPRCADQALLLWLTTQAGRNLYTSPLALFEAPVFHPLRHALAYSESMLSAAVVAGPLEALTGSFILAYNLHYLGTIVLSVVGMYLLVREITRDRVSALVAGGLFGLATERGLWWDFPPALAVHWAPVLLWTWLRFLDLPSGGRGIALGLALLAHMHSGAYHGLMLPALLVPWALVLMAFGPWPVRRWLASAPWLGLGGVLAAGLYYPYVVVRDELHYSPVRMAVALPEQYVAGIVDPLAYVDWRVFRSGEGFLVSPLPWYLLAAAALAALVRRRPRIAPAAGLGPHLAGALLLALLAALVSIGVVLPTPFGLVPGPLALLRELPGFDGMRAVVRFMMLSAFGRTLVAGLAMAILVRRLPRAAGRAAAALVLLLAAGDARLDAARPVHDFTIPAPWARGYRWLAGTVPGTPVVEVPYGTWTGDAFAMVYALSHRRPIMNGYSAAMPRFTDTVGRLPDPVAWRALREAGVQYVLVHPSLLLAHPLTAPRLTRLRWRRDLVVAELDDTLILAVPPAAELPEPPLGEPVPRDGWRVRPPARGAHAAIDGDLATHWEADSTDRPVRLRVDLGRETRLSALVIAVGAHVLEYPRQYHVHGSLDGRSWTWIGGEPFTVPPFASYRRDHRDVRLRLRIAPTTVRWLRITVPRYPTSAWTWGGGRWAIHELLAYESPPDAPAPADRVRRGRTARALAGRPVRRLW